MAGNWVVDGLHCRGIYVLALLQAVHWLRFVGGALHDLTCAGVAGSQAPENLQSQHKSDREEAAEGSAKRWRSKRGYPAAMI
jgi:hypothetical protein